MIGPQYGSDNNEVNTRQDKTGCVVVSEGHGKYYEAASRGFLFFAADQGVGVATTTAISTTAMFSLYNPPQSGKRVAILKVRIGYFSGTLGAGPIYHCVNPMIAGTANPTAPTSGTLLTAYTSDIMNVSVYSAAAAQAVARTSSAVVAPIVHSPICSVNAILASSATGIYQVSDDVAGEIILEPGGLYQIQSLCASGSTPKVTIGVSWQETIIVSTQG